MSPSIRLRAILASLLVLQIALPPRRAEASPTDSSTLQGERGAVAASGPVGTQVGHDAFRGAATYSVPIALPAGTGGMQPALALGYSSQSRHDSWVGYGWSLGLPSISRSLKRGVPAYDDQLDVFVLDGEELVPETSNPALPRRYHTERQSFLRIVHETNGSWTVTRKDGTQLRLGTTANSRVTNAGGLPFEWLLSEQEDLRGNALIVSYDRRDAGTAYPAEIRYTLRRAGSVFQSLGNDPSRDRVVEFVLKPRPDASVSYAAGLQQTLAHRLARIDVVAIPGLVRRYELVYAQSPDSFRSLLTEVQLFGSDANAALPTEPFVTSFAYHSNVTEGTTGWQLASAAEFAWTLGLSLVGSDNQDQGVRLGDMNGDALPDLIKAYSTVASNGTHTLSSDSGVYLNTGNGFSPVRDSSFSAAWPWVTGLTGNAIPLAFAWNFASGVVWGNGMSPIDLTGDGRVDFVGAIGIPPLHGGITNQPVSQSFQGPWCRSTGNGFDCAQTFPDDYWVDGKFFTAKQGIIWTNPNDSLALFAGGLARFAGNSQFGDLDGDGLADVVVRGEERQAIFSAGSCRLRAVRSYVAYNLGDLQFAQAPLSSVPLPPSGCTNEFQTISLDYQPCDLAQAGCAEKVFFAADELASFGIGYGWVYQSNVDYGNAIVDLNADGLDDTSASTEDLAGTWVRSAGLNDGRGGYVDAPLWAIPYVASLIQPETTLSPYGATRGKSVDCGVRYADVNGDGRVDVVFGLQGAGRTTWLNDGDTNEGPSGSPWISSAAWQLPSGLEFTSASGQDLGVRLLDVDGDGMVDVIRSRGGANDVYLNRGSAPDLLTEVATPLGSTTRITYVPSTLFDNTGGDLPDLPQVVQVVDSITVEDGRGNASTTAFEYEDGLFDADEREFRGFATVVATDAIGRERITRFHQDDAKVGLPYEETLRVGSQLWSQVFTTYTNDTNGAPYVSLARLRDVREWDGQASPRRTLVELFYEGGVNSLYGNLVARREYGEWNGADIDPSDTRSVSLEYALNAPAWLVDRVARVRVWDGLQNTGTLVGERQVYYDGHSGLFAAPTLGNATRRVDVLGEAGKPDPTTTFGYDAFGNVTSVTDPRANAAQGGGTTTFEYDPLYSTFPAAAVNALGHRHEYSYAVPGACGVITSPAAGLLGEQRGPNDLLAGTRWVRCYDVFGRIVLERAPGDLTETDWSYVDVPGFTTITETARATVGGSGRTRTDYLDGLGRVILTLGDGPENTPVARQQGFDEVGRLASETAPYFFNPFGSPPPPTLYDYDPLDRVVQVTLPGTDRLHTFAYAPGLVTSFDANGNETRRRLDPFDNVVEVEEVTSGGTHLTTYAYDARDQLILVTDALGNETEVQYDKLGRKRLLDDPDGGVTTFDYDANGNLVLRSGPLGSVSWTYDAVDRVFNQIEDGATKVGWRYDYAPGKGLGLLNSLSDGAQLYVALSYDLLGRPLGERVDAGGKRFNFTNAYDPLGQLLTRQYPTNRVVEWVRDDAGFLVGVRTGGEDYATDVEWDAEGRLEAWTSGAGVETRYAYDFDTARLDTLVVSGGPGGTLEDLEYTFDPGDRLQSILDHRDITRSRSFGYDELDRLTYAAGPYGSSQGLTEFGYEYDAIGNLTCKEGVGLTSCTGGTVYTYPSPGPGAVRPHAPLTVGALSPGYDAGGNLTALGSRTYEYDRHSRLAKAWSGGAILASFLYDGRGRLARIEDFSMGTPSVKRFIVTRDFEWRTLNSLGRTHVWLAGSVIATHEESFTPPSVPKSCSGTLPMVSADGDSPLDLLGLFVPGFLALAVLWLYAWALRATRGARWRAGVAAATGVLFFVATVAPPFDAAVPQAEAVSPTGVVYFHGDHLASSVVVTSSTGTLLQRKVYKPFGEVVPATAGGSTAAPEFGFTGQRYVPAVGIYDYGARWYDPALARFLQPDPIVPEPLDPQSLNRYSYVLNSPPNWIDPTGYQQRRTLRASDIGAGRFGFAGDPLAAEAFHGSSGEGGGGFDYGSAGSFLGGLIGNPFLGSLFGNLVGTYMQYGFVGFSTTIPLGGAPQAQVPDGALGIAETAWDVFNAGLGVKAVIEDIQEGSYGWAVVDGIGAAYDIFAAAVPVLPGGASAGIKGIKAGAARAGGRLGGTAHRGTVASRAADLERQGHTVTAGGGRLPERSVITPEGNRRFPDISTRDPSGNPYYENVGRSTTVGNPVARERRALEDIRRATGTEPGYTPYDR